ncbi:MAG: TonB-dependent receptor [Bacteroidetes bacterium]|nr:TonB-dependent receptor [Bacteroidota bacterium]
MKKLWTFGQKGIILMVLSLSLNVSAFATNVLQINGLVKDATSGEPLIGCSVSAKGTSSGTVTDLDGKFSIEVTDATSVLVFSYVGYKTLEITVGNQTNLVVNLELDGQELAQVVVIGYGTTSTKDITGAAKSIKSDDFNKGIINSPEQLLQGKVAGVNVVGTSGEPGARQNITVRGPGGVRTGSTPLFVVDGFALDNSGTGGATNPLTFLNPNDIESIDVLKDASATAIYGARGANGVILITTKKGKAGFSSVTYSGSLGISNIARKLDLFSADEYRKQVKAIGGTLEDLGADTDWQEVIMRTAKTQNHNLSFSGGSGNTSFFGSVGVQNQQGILQKSDLDQYVGRVKINQKSLNGRLNIEMNLNASQVKANRPPIGTLLGTALSMNPTYAAYNSTGGINVFQGTFVNPLSYFNLEKDITTTNRVMGNISPSLTLFKGLDYKLNLGVDHSTFVRDIQSLASATPRQDGRLDTEIGENNNQLIENYLTYKFVNKQINLNLLAGHSYQRIFLHGRNSSINKFPISDLEPIYNPGLGQDLTIANNKPGGYALINELQSFFSRANFQFKDKYLLTATVRADGSSKFGANNKYGIFPSFSAGWRLSEESFLKNSVFSDLKIRAGWGQTGNQEIPSKITQPLYTNTVTGTTSYPLSPTGAYPVGISFARLANPDIQWEVSTQIDFGIDFSMFNGALSGTVDYFNKVSNNILLEVIPADPVQPATTFWTNVEDMTITNQGVEFELNYQKRSDSGWSYGLGANLTLIDNVVENSPYSVIPSGSASGPGLTSATINGYINGQPIGTFYLKDFIGFDDKGQSKFRDVNNDGIVTDADRIAAGTALPSTMYNFNGDLGYKGLSLSVNFNGVSGNKVYDNTANANFYKLRLSKGINVTPEAIQYPEESTTNAAPISTRYLKDGSFFRLNNLSLAYDVNTSKLGLDKWISQFRVYVTGQNLMLWTKYDGYDPEVNTDRTINGISSYGIDYLSYPRAKSILFGLNLSF